MRSTLYIQEKKTSVFGLMVREVEELLGSRTDWAKHFYNQFHHEMASARLHKKSILGSHMRMIFYWSKRERSKEQVDPLLDNIPPPAPKALTVRQIAPPIPIEDQERNGVVASSTKERRSKRPAEVAQDIAKGEVSLATPRGDLVMVDVLSPKKKSPVAQ
ncbi:unnamed protein product [Calypogeia fissa]